MKKPTDISIAIQLFCEYDVSIVVAIGCDVSTRGDDII